MKPGRSLDCLVAQHVMGLQVCQCDEEQLRADYLKERQKRYADPYAFHFDGGFHRFGSNGNCNFCGKIYVNAVNYSTDIATAWQVVEKLRSERPRDSHTDLVTEIRISFEKDGQYEVRLIDQNFNTWVTITRASLPHAICLAALEAVGALPPV